MSVEQKGKTEKVAVKIYNLSGEVVGTEKVALSGGPVNRKILYYAVNAYQANQRQGNASAKTRAEVSGGGRKPWRQKGTGRARVGSNRSPIWRTGGVVFGPKPRDYRVNLPRKVKQAALKEALRDKLFENRVCLLSETNLPEVKTRLVSDFLKKAAICGKLIIFTTPEAEQFRRASRNIPGLFFADTGAPDFYRVLNADYLVVAQDCWDKIAARFNEKEKSVKPAE